MVRLLEWEVVLLIEVCNYFTGYLISQKEISLKPKRSWWIIGGIFLLFPVIVYNLNDWSYLDIYMLLLMLALTGIILIMDAPIKRRIWQSFILYFCISSINGVSLSFFDRWYTPGDFSIEIHVLFVSLRTLVFLVAILLIKNVIKKRSKKKSEIFYNKLAQSSFIICGFLQCLSAAIIVDELSDIRVYYIIGLLSYLGVAFLGSQIWVVINMNTRMKELLKEERLLHSTQKEYYQSLLNKEEETRKYRHDMTNHLMVMDALLSENDIDELKEYLRDLRKEFGTVQAKRYVTGNAVIDAISSYYLPMVDDFVDIKVRGSIPSTIKTDEVSICTIYSNLVKNAVEEAKRLKDDGTSNIKILIDFKSGEEFYSISVKNTMRDKATFKGINTPTSKKDYRNHGIGLGNIKRTVEKERGRIKIEKKDKMFMADVILPIA
jgi:hypothetical protein